MGVVSQYKNALATAIALVKQEDVHGAVGILRPYRANQIALGALFSELGWGTQPARIIEWLSDFDEVLGAMELKAPLSLIHTGLLGLSQALESFST